MWLNLRVKWLVLWSLWAARLVPQPTLTVRVSSGLLRGSVAPRGSHASYFAIPYATVEERFQAAKPVPPWHGVFNAYNEHIRCTQRFSGSHVLGQEDCLTLNIYTPLPAHNKPLPVMVFIHGGGFRDGSGSPLMYGPDYLVRHGVILVTFNYRLEVLGFLCLGVKEAPGNAGLKDQAEALQWVKKNIKAFGGDPDNITIFGESAGSASVGYHLVSHLSKGLFHKAIMQSGSAMSPWSMQFEPLKTAKLLSQQIGPRIEDPIEIYKLFKNLTAEDLMKTRVPRKDGDIVLSENIFVPCVEKNLPNVEGFLTDTPYNLITKGDYNRVPLIIGYNNAEGFMFAGKENDTIIPKLDFNKALPRDLDIPSEEEKRRIADVLRRYYMGDKIISKESMVEFARFEGDSSIIYPVIFTIDILLKTMENPVYAYKLNYSGWLNLAKFVYGFGKEPGATHADEIFYMFKIRTTLPMTFFEKDFIDRITELWTNFAKYGNPTPTATAAMPTKWEPADRKNPHVLDLDKTCSSSPLWNDEIIRFWNATYTKYRRKE